MKKILVLVLVAILLVVGCSKDSAPAKEKPAEEKPAEEKPAEEKPAEEKPAEEKPAEGKQKLVISTWGLSEDSLWKDVYLPFEEKYNVEIVLDTGTTAERYTKLESNPDTEIDVIELSQAYAAKGYKADLFEKLDYSKLESYNDLIAPVKQLMDENGYGPAYTINSIGIIYDKEAVGFEITEWKDLWKPELEGKVSLPDITTTFGPALLYMASDVKGVDITTDKGEAAFEALGELKPNVARTYAKSSDLANLFANGEVAVAVVGDFGVPVIQKAKEGIEYVVPASGTYANLNTIDINKNSKNKDLAYAYINYRTEVATQKGTIISLNEAPTNSKVELSEEESMNKTYGDIAARAKTIDYVFVNEHLDSWVDQYNRLMNQ